ncbi:hypothetical protein GCM10010302_27820 [Streptomyces polychromogenes]|uniref:Small hydrophobic protein n=1 Tax=Streptomyces polychromogenes TaxID=67342 RepID=A0ABP3F0B4_9ACTN
MTHDTQDDGASGSRAAAREQERWKAKGVALRAFFYIAGTHVFAAFVMLLFYLGQHAQK